MSLIFMDGFDDGLTTEKWTTLSNVGVAAGGRTLNKLSVSSGNVMQAIKVLPVAAQHATWFFGFAMAVNSSGNAEFLRVLGDNNTTIHLVFEILNTNAIQVRRGSGGTILGTTASSVFVPGVASFFFYEFKVVLSDTVGVVQIKINGITVLNLTNVDTKNGGTGLVFDTFNFIQNFGMGIGIDDLYLLNGAGSVNNNFIGDCSVLTRFPDGDGNYSQGTNSGGTSVNNYTYVDEQPPNISDYVTFPATGVKDTYTFTDLPTGSVYGVQQAAYAAKADAGARTIRNIQRIAGTDYASADQGLSITPTYVGKFDIMETSPATGVLWTATEINAAEFGTEARP